MNGYARGLDGSGPSHDQEVLRVVRGRGGECGVTQTYGDGSLPFLAALGEHAKQHPKRRYRNLHKTMCGMDVLQWAWAQAVANDGAAGIDGIGFAAIEKGPGGINGFLEKLQSDLWPGTYHPQPVRRVNIPKEGKPLRAHTASWIGCSSGCTPWNTPTNVPSGTCAPCCSKMVVMRCRSRPHM
jgi:hypothetical protein